MLASSSEDATSGINTYSTFLYSPFSKSSLLFFTYDEISESLIWIMESGIISYGILKYSMFTLSFSR